MNERLNDKQKWICYKYSAAFFECDLNLKVGISKNVKDDIGPLNALRINPTDSTSGWYIWAGDWSDEENFFVPLHGIHLDVWAPQIMSFLALPPGWRVLLNGNYEDAWEDPELELG